MAIGHQTFGIPTLKLPKIHMKSPKLLIEVLLRGTYSMVYVVAYKPGALHCPPWQQVQGAATRPWHGHGIARGCSFGRSRRQLLMARQHQADYGSYFLGPEELHMERLRKAPCRIL